MGGKKGRHGMTDARSTQRRPLLPWRYGLFLAVLLTAFPAAGLLGPLRGLMAGFDIAALVFLASLGPLFSHDGPRIRAHVRENDANRPLVLILSAIVSLVVLVSVALEIGGGARPDGLTIAVVLATLALAWLFSNIVYTLQYAYLFYEQDQGGDRGGIAFPGTDEPDYRDFAYFSLTLGMTFQTSDVSISSREIRRVVLVHCLAAFVFNLGILAFTINILGG